MMLMVYQAKQVYQVKQAIAVANYRLMIIVENKLKFVYQELSQIKAIVEDSFCNEAFFYCCLSLC